MTPCDCCGLPPVPEGELWGLGTHCPRSLRLPMGSAAHQNDAARMMELDCLRLGMTRLRAENAKLVAQLENILDAHRDGAWMARALDAERELAAAVERAERAEAELGKANACWHCKVCLLPTKPRCETCPDECDDEACSDEGCREARGE